MRSAALLVGIVLGLAACDAEETHEGAFCPLSSAPPSGAHRLYLAFDGMIVVPGADDATLNRSLLVPAEATVPAFLGNDPEAPTKIAEVVASVRESLSAFDVEVVTERPAEGPYDLIVFGGYSLDVVGKDGIQFAAPETCAEPPPSQVGFVFEVRKPMVATAQTAVGIFAAMHGATMTAKPGDCLCLGDDACSPVSTQCSFGASVAGSPKAACDKRTRVDSVGEMIEAFGCR